METKRTEKPARARERIAIYFLYGSRRNFTIYSLSLILTGKRQSRLQLSQLEVFSRCLNAKSETISKFEYQMTKTLPRSSVVTQYLSRASKISFVLNLGFGTFVFVSNFVLRVSNL
jgi:hypothetical protein